MVCKKTLMHHNLDQQSQKLGKASLPTKDCDTQIALNIKTYM